MGNFAQIKETVTQQIENISQTVQENIPKVKETIESQIPVVKSKFDDTINFCKSKFIPPEDKAEIYALYTNEEKPEENFEDPLKSQMEFQSINLDNVAQSQYPQNINPSAPRQLDDKDYIRELIDLCNENGETPPYDDFNQNAWEHFYSADEPFFMWDKGDIVPNRIKVTNPHDYKNLEIYQGDMTSDLNTRHGFGILTTPFYVRIGQWRYGQFTGWGRECRRNGEVLEGRFTNGKVNGKGIFITKKGNKYVGDILNNRLHGKGKLTTRNIQYAGDFKYNQMDGIGKIIFNNGHQYEGEFRENNINGKGKFTWRNGDTYEGIMYNGKMNGFGKYTYASNGQIYEGNFVNGVKRGDGKITYPSGKIYEGKFLNGVPQGQGTIIENGKNIDIVFRDGKAYQYRYD
jgi:hypothetical protein